jgi:hypothetical protein
MDNRKLSTWGSIFTNKDRKQDRREVEAYDKEDAINKLQALRKEDENMSDPIEAVGP